MNILKKVLFVLFICTFSSLFFGCSYKPSSHYAKEEIKGNVYLNVTIDLEDPQNSVLIKDSIRKTLIQKLDVDIVEKESLADVIMNVNVGGVGMQALQYGSHRIEPVDGQQTAGQHQSGQGKGRGSKLLLSDQGCVAGSVRQEQYRCLPPETWCRHICSGSCCSQDRQ